MIVVREVFICKPGMASKLAKMWKEEMPKMKIMTDLVGGYNTVVAETEYEDLSGWEADMKKYMDESSKAISGKKAVGPNYTDMYLEGRREIYRIW